MDKIAEIITRRAEEIFDETLRLRRHFHMYPEISFREFETSQFISAFLESNEIEYVKNIAGTGIIAWVNGQKGKGKVVALRAEMDALQISEKTSLDYKSKNKGLMHACGHDAHMAMLMSAIIIIKEIRSEFGGRVAFIFQPGEEMAPGGAKLMMDTQDFRKLDPDLIIAQHVLPELDAGKTGFAAGKYMASSDEIHISILGRGGHAALSDQNSDQVLIGSELVMTLGEIVNEYRSDEATVLRIGRFIAAGSTNIIPEEASLQGTIRTFDEKARASIKERVRTACRQIGDKYGVEVKLHLPDGYPVLVNSTEHVNISFELARSINGERMVEKLGPRMSSEDFAFYSQKYPVVFYRLGVRNKSKQISPLHSPGFVIDEKAMLTGTRTLTYLGVKFTEGR
ncbi:MAG: M20 family metallopeptidase [Bacteroidales bacterium]|jgi:amidohydrolase|nr:M20 family metallopeptidase [Bacteroidales bacterium]